MDPSRSPEPSNARSGSSLLPAWFLSHGSPMIALDEGDYSRALRTAASALPAPRAIVVVSAHWQTSRGVGVTSAAHPEIIYDFGGFPAALYALRYPAPGDPELARDLVGLLAARDIPATLIDRRGLDHGVWIPLRLAFPEARIPVVQVSLPAAPPETLIQLGQALRPLRERNVLLVGSGGIVHNLGRVRFEDKQAPVEPWARAFDTWVRDRVEGLELDALRAYRTLGPHASEAVPSSEHFDPVLVVLGAVYPGERVTPIFEGFEYGTLSMRSFAVG